MISHSCDALERQHIQLVRRQWRVSEFCSVIATTKMKSNEDGMPHVECNEANTSDEPYLCDFCKSRETAYDWEEELQRHVNDDGQAMP